MGAGTLLFFYPLFMFFIAGFVMDKIQPQMSFLVKAFMVLGGGFMFILIINQFLFPGTETLSSKNPILIIHAPIAYAVWLTFRLTMKPKQ